MGKAGNHADVMGDEQVGQPQFSLQALQQFQYPGLYRDVQRAGGFVADQQFRPHGQRPGYADALPLPARELVRITVFMRRVKSDLDEQLIDHFLPVPITPCHPQGGHAFLDDVLDHHLRVH